MSLFDNNNKWNHASCGPFDVTVGRLLYTENDVRVFTVSAYLRAAANLIGDTLLKKHVRVAM